jgi:hypothetical protein
VTETDDGQKANERLTESVSAYLAEMGWEQPGTTLTDVLVVAVRRGWSDQGGMSLVNAVVTTDTTPIMTLGMVRYAQMKYELAARAGFEEPQGKTDGD